MANLQVHISYDPEFASEHTKKLYELYLQGLRALETGGFNEPTKKALRDGLTKSGTQIIASVGAEKRRKATQEAIKERTEYHNALKMKKAEKMIEIAGLRIQHANMRSKMEVARANVDSLIATCRSLTVQVNNIDLENKRIEKVGMKNRDRWTNINDKLGNLLHRMTNLRSRNPKMHIHQKEVEAIEMLQNRLTELQCQKERLLQRKEFFESRIGKGITEEEFILQARDFAHAHAKFYEKVVKFKETVAELEERERRVAARNSKPRDLCDLDPSELDDTRILLQYAGEHFEDSERQQSQPDEEEQQSAVDSEMAVEEVVVPVVAPPSRAPSAPPVQAVAQPVLPPVFERQLSPISTPVRMHSRGQLQADVDQEHQENVMLEQDAADGDDPMADGGLGSLDPSDVLNISQNSQDPAGDFLSMMQGDTGKASSGPAAFTFNMGDGDNFEQAPAFAFDCNTQPGGAGAPDASFNFNFDVSDMGGAAGDSSFNFNFDAAPQENSDFDSGGFNFF